MKKRPFGDSGLSVSEIGLGLAALGRPGYINLGHHSDLNSTDPVEMEKQSHEVLNFARENGVTYFDVARSYGRAEEFLANWMHHQCSLTDIVVGSKWGYYYTADWKIEAEKHEIKEHSLERLNQQWPKSKELLSSALKLYQIHFLSYHR